CFSTQLGAFLSTDNLKALEVTSVRVQRGSVRNTVLDSGSVEQVEMNTTPNSHWIFDRRPSYARSSETLTTIARELECH
ncbi:hypothetical protein ACC772_38220, partial [Rhizobium ruizarguesonis]